MLDFQQRRKIRNLTYSRITLLILFLLVLFMVRSTWNVYQKKRISEEMKNLSLENVEKLRLRDNELGKSIEKLETDSGVEEEIRLKFNVVKSGENMAVIVEDEKNNLATTTNLKIGWWNELLNFFKN